MNARTVLPVVALGWLAFGGALAAQTATPTPAPGPAASDPIEGTRWLGELDSPSGSTPFGVELRRSQQGTLMLVEYMPAMHVFSQPTSRVTPHDGGYVLNDLPGSARVDGDRLVGVAFFAAIPFRLSRVDSFPAPPDQTPPALPAGPTPLWSRALGAPVWGDPMVKDGVLYVGTSDGRFHALRARDGGDVWTWTGTTPIHGAALVSGDAVFFVDDRSALVCLDRRSGVLRYRVALDPAREAAAKVPDDDTYDHRVAAPVLAGGVLYVGSTAGTVFALRPHTGAVVWRAAAGAKICAPVAVDGDRVLVGAFDGTLLALRRGSGAELWRQKIAGPIVSAPVVHRDLVIVGGRDYQLHAYDAAHGRERWHQHFWASWVESTPRIAGGVLYVGSSDLRAVRAIDPTSGRVLWSTDVFGSIWGSPAVSADSVYVGVIGVTDYPIDHRPSLVALDRRHGAIRWRRAEPAQGDGHESGHPGTPALVGGVLYVGGLDGTVVALPAR